MLDTNLKGKRLLLIGGIGLTADLIDLAHRNGVLVGVADYNKGTKLKQIADAAYDVDALDVDAIAGIYENDHYDGVISNFNDMLSPYVALVAERVGAYSPYTIEQLKMSTDKKFFKETCIKYDIPVPQEYKINQNEDINKLEIEFPVIVKPIDGSGSKGITVCYTKSDLLSGLKKAKDESKTGDIIVEEYIPYNEINVTYIIQDGDVQLAAIHDRYFNTEQEGVIRVPDMYIYPSRYTDTYMKKYNEKVISMLKGIGIKNGSLFMQAVVRNDNVYFYEAGMRLNGCKTYQILEVENDYNTFEHLMNFALTGSMGKYCIFNPKMKRWYATWNVVGTPGAVCKSFEGKKELETYPWLIHIAGQYTEGEKIPESAKGTLIQLVARIHVLGETKNQLFERIERMYEMYHVKDKDGREILMKPHDVKDLRTRLNYDLWY